jgi:RNA polymerase sigma-70 factor (ECF subfamily)
MTAWGQYRPAPEGGHKPWALLMIEPRGERIASMVSFLDTDAIFPRFGLPPALP